MTPDNLTQWRADLKLSELAFSRYLGAPINTVRNWLKARRKPDAATMRLFELLQRIQRDAPLVHADLIREAQDDPPAAPVQPMAGAIDPDQPQVSLEPQNAPEPVPGWLKMPL